MKKCLIALMHVVLWIFNAVGQTYPYQDASRPIKELEGFRKVSLEPGESKSVTWTLSTDDLKFYDHEMNYVVEPGRFKIVVGASSEDIKFETSFNLE